MVPFNRSKATSLVATINRASGRSGMALFESSGEGSESRKLLHRAPQLRAEIAATEGTTVDEGETETRRKKESEREQREQKK